MSEFITKRQIHNLVFYTASFLSIVVIIDHIGYQFGYTTGLIGFNQDAILKWGISRPHAFSSEPSYIASFLSISIFFVCPEVIKRKSFTSIILTAIMCLAVFSTTSRTGWVSIVLGSIYLIFFYLRDLKKIPWKVLFVSILSIFTFLILSYYITPEKQKKRFHHELLNPILTWDDGSHKARVRSQLMAWKIAKETNFIGTGLGASFLYWVSNNEVDRGEKEKNETLTSDRGKEVIMSTWGQLLAEGGIFALLLYLSSAIIIIKKLMQNKDYLYDNQKMGALVSSLLFFTFITLFLSNIARGDVWVWIALWGFNTWNINPSLKPLS
ncbi:MAG: O-antigen ligase family protein [Oligoflexia bacterium]|nr:O-antigen ligase family protein [Oligoflexia bacterium]